MLLHKVKIESFNNGANAHVYVDDKNIKASAVDVHMEVSCVPQTDITIYSEPDLEIDSLVTSDFIPNTYKMAMEVLKAGLKKNDLVAYLSVNSLVAQIEKK
jgi:hypothetical protein